MPFVCEHGVIGKPSGPDDESVLRTKPGGARGLEVKLKKVGKRAAALMEER